MAGEFKIANDSAIVEVTASAAMTEISVLNALLNSVLAKLMVTNSIAERLNHIDSC
jgi:hypothetical protein